jgi:hypothetical protein
LETHVHNVVEIHSKRWKVDEQLSSPLKPTRTETSRAAVENAPGRRCKNRKILELGNEVAVKEELFNNSSGNISRRASLFWGKQSERTLRAKPSQREEQLP